MKIWNDLDGSTFFNQVFTTPIAINMIELFTISIDNSRPTIIIEFDILELPDAPLTNWKKSEFNTCRIGLNCGGISDLKINNMPTKEKLNITKKTKRGQIYFIRENKSVPFFIGVSRAPTAV